MNRRWTVGLAVLAVVVVVTSGGALFTDQVSTAGRPLVEMLFRPWSAIWGPALPFVSLVGALALGVRESLKPSLRTSLTSPVAYAHR
jgi:hypothetical protein